MAGTLAGVLIGVIAGYLTARHSAEIDPEVMEAAEAHNSGPSTDVLAERAAILKIVARLPTKQRQVIMLFYMEEQSHEEVAAMLAMPVGTVKTLLHRARAQLHAGAAKLRSTA